VPGRDRPVVQRSRETTGDVVDLDPENVASRIKLAELYSKEALKEEAVEEFSKAADFLRAENRIDDFIKVAERLVFHSPENMEITRELAGIYLRKKDPRRALQKLQLAFKADPRDERTLEMLAEAGATADEVHSHSVNDQISLAQLEPAMAFFALFPKVFVATAEAAGAD